MPLFCRLHDDFIERVFFSSVSLKNENLVDSCN